MVDHESGLSSVTPTPAIINLIESAANSFETDRAVARDCLYRACALIRAQKKSEQPIAASTGKLIAWQTRRAFDFIDSRLGTPLQIRDVASELHMSVSHFFRSFKATVGMTPREYITRRRIESAQNLICTTRQSFSDIAIECGLNDQSHLCRVFRRFVGQSPNAWRRANAFNLSR
jgi:AraC family transcriptional regulator